MNDLDLGKLVAIFHVDGNVVELTFDHVERGVGEAFVACLNGEPWEDSDEDWSSALGLDAKRMLAVSWAEYGEDGGSWLSAVVVHHDPSS